MTTRRDFFKNLGMAGGAVAAASVSSVALAALPELVSKDNPDTASPLTPPNGRPYNPVVTLNGWTLPWRMNNGVKEFHLVAEPVVREIAPGMKAQGSMRPAGKTQTQEVVIRKPGSHGQH